MLTYILIKSPEHAPVSNKQKEPARCWLTSCSNPEHTRVSNQQEGSARSWLTSCSKPRACSCEQQAGRASQRLTYILIKTQSMLMWARSRKGQPDANLHSIQNPKHAYVSNKQEGPARWWSTDCSKYRVHSCQKEAGVASQMLTYILFKTQSRILSVTSRQGQLDSDLHPVQNPEGPLVSNKQEGPARCWLTYWFKPRACSYQQQAGVTHYLCVKCGELSMKVVWRAGMAMVWRLSCDQLWSKPKLSPKREK